MTFPCRPDQIVKAALPLWLENDPAYRRAAWSFLIACFNGLSSGCINDCAREMETARDEFFRRWK